MQTRIATLVMLATLAPLALAQSSPGTVPLRHLNPIRGGGVQTVGGDTADIRVLRLSPDEKRLVYVADAEQDELTELYALKPQGGLPLKLSLPFVPGRAGVIDFRISPDGQRVLYLADHAERARWELYSVSINGGPVVKISRPSSVPMAQGDYVFTPDSRRVVYIDKPGSLRELFVASLDGRPYTQLSQAQGNVNAQSLRVLSDSSRVVFQSVTGNSFTIRSVRLDGSETPHALSSGIVSFGPVACETTPGGARVLYGGNGGERNLMSVPSDGSAAAVALNGLLQPTESVGSWNLAADGKHVLFVSNEGGPRQLRSAPVDGSSVATTLSDFVGGESLLFPFLTGTSGRVTFLARRMAQGPIGLESAPLAGDEAPTLLSLPDQNLSLSFPDRVGGWGPLMRLTPDGQHAFYLSSDAARFTSLHVVALDGSTTPLQVADLAADEWLPIYFFPGDRTADLDFDPVRGLALYRTVSSTTGTARLFSVPFDGSTPPRELTSPLLPETEGARLFVTAPQLGRVFYTSDALQPGVFELFSVPTDGSKAPLQLVDF